MKYFSVFAIIVAVMVALNLLHIHINAWTCLIFLPIGWFLYWNLKDGNPPQLNE